LALGLPALLGLRPDHPLPDNWALHPSSGLHQSPLNYWTCAWLHANTPHLLANIAGLALILALGWITRVSPPHALAWMLAWPLTHLALLLDPRLDTYYGLSGVLHAGVGIIALALIGQQPRQTTRHARRLGWALLGGLLLKCWLENPHWRATLDRDDLSMTVAPLSHWAGTLTGITLALALSKRQRYSQSRP
jgi:membrane associated rhomboid family serine protease